jgi:hypothetical protein
MRDLNTFVLALEKQLQVLYLYTSVCEHGDIMRNCIHSDQVKASSAIQHLDPM